MVLLRDSLIRQVSLLCLVNDILIILSDDFAFGEEYIVFQSGSKINDTVCFNFMPTDDKIIENTEMFVFRVYSVNVTDSFIDYFDEFSILINDDDGKLTF